PGGRHQAAAVVDGAAGLVAEQVGVNVADAEGARAFDDEAFAHLALAEGEVARRGVEQQVDALPRQHRARARAHPGVLADLEADADAADVEDEVAERPALLTALELG